METMSQSMEASKTVNNVKDRLADAEAQNLSNNRLLFAVDEKFDGEGRNWQLNKRSIWFNQGGEKHRLKSKDWSSWKWANTYNCETIPVQWSGNGPKKGSTKGYELRNKPKSHAILAKRKKVTSIVLEKRKEEKAIFMVWDKLYEDGALWKKNEIAGGVAMLSQRR